MALTIEEREIWRDIEGYEEKYQVSNLGNVKSLNYNHTGRENPLTFGVNKGGYLYVTLCKNGKTKNYLVHRLVAEAFILDKTNFKYVNEEDRLKYVNNLDKLDVNHKDEEPKNNRVNNLEWCTNWYNQLYGTKSERVAKANTNNPKLSKNVYQYDLDGNLIKIWASAREIKRQLGYSQGSISSCCRGEYKTMYGYIWRYAD